MLHIEPLIPPGKPGGGKRRVAIREVINGVHSEHRRQWRALPKDLPPKTSAAAMRSTPAARSQPQGRYWTS